MIYLNNILQLIEFKITGGTEFLWNCFGTNARYLDSDNSEYSISCIFDSVTQEVYKIQFYVNNSKDLMDNCFWLNPAYRQNFLDESESRNVDPYSLDEDIAIYEFMNLHDFITHIRNRVGIEEMETISLDLEDDLLISLTKLAQERNVTLDVLIQNILRIQMQKEGFIDELGNLTPSAQQKIAELKNNEN